MPELGADILAPFLILVAAALLFWLITWANKKGKL
jgi:hypothetical protein